MSDHPHTDPGDGRTECPTCGKWVWLVTHSCKGVPVTQAAMDRLAPAPPEQDEPRQEWDTCTTPGCDGDARYAAPGRRHIEGCTYPRPVGRVEADAETAWQEFCVEREWPDREDVFYESFMGGYQRALEDALAAKMRCPCSDECEVMRPVFIANMKEWLGERAAGLAATTGENE